MCAKHLPVEAKHHTTNKYYFYYYCTNNLNLNREIDLLANSVQCLLCKQ